MEAEDRPRPIKGSANSAQLLVDPFGGDWQGGDPNSHGILDRVGDGGGPHEVRVFAHAADLVGAVAEVGL